MIEVFKAILIVWGIMYLTTARVKPDLLKSVGGNPISTSTSRLMMLVMGILTLGSVAANHWILFGILGAIEASGAAESYTGYYKWRVNPEKQDMYQLAMAVMDFVAAIVFFSLMLNQLALNL